MTFVYPEINSVFQFEQQTVSTLVIENKKMYRDFLLDIYKCVNGNDGKSVLSNDNKILDISKNVEIIDNILNLDINNKTLISKIISKIDKKSSEDLFLVETNELINSLEKHIICLTEEYPCSFSMNKLSFLTLLKSIGIEIVDDYDNILEKALDYFELVKEFDSDKLFIIVNLRSYFEDESCSLFFDSLVTHNIKVLLIENTSYKLLNYEKRITIDDDCCEF